MAALINENGTEMSPWRAGELSRHRDGLYAEQRGAFYRHYNSCASYRPTSRCDAGAALQREYDIACSAAHIIHINGRMARALALGSVKADIRKQVEAKVTDLWPIRFPEGW